MTKPRQSARPHVPDHVWLPASGPYLSAHIRYSWTGAWPDFPALCVPAALWTPFAALVCGASGLRPVSHWARYFRALVMARWVLCQPVSVPALLQRAGPVVLVGQQLELWAA